MLSQCKLMQHIKVFLKDLTQPGAKKAGETNPMLLYHTAELYYAYTYVYYQGLLSPKSGIKIVRNFPPVLGTGSPQLLTQVFPTILGFFPL